MPGFSIFYLVSLFAAFVLSKGNLASFILFLFKIHYPSLFLQCNFLRSLTLVHMFRPFPLIRRKKKETSFTYQLKQQCMITVQRLCTPMLTSVKARVAQHHRITQLSTQTPHFLFSGSGILWMTCFFSTWHLCLFSVDLQSLTL